VTPSVPQAESETQAEENISPDVQDAVPAPDKDKGLVDQILRKAEQLPPDKQ
jgi:hypothetical protein